MITGLVSCSDGASGPVKRGFYFWQSGDLNNYEEHYLKETNAEKLYVKIFEVTNDEIEGAIPVTKSYMELPTRILSETEIIPCIFIENEVIAKSTDDQLEQLAENTVFLTKKFLDEKLPKVAGDKVTCEEIQIDCDWMESDKEEYFKFLKAIKKHWDKKLSCTLRLYPYKFTEAMGVPPVDRAMLLCYNLLDPKTNNNKNSILNLQEMKKYIETDKAYPLPLDVALPTYSSCYIFENAKFEEVQHGISKELEGACHAGDDNLWFTVKSDTVIHYEYYEKGQRLKIERVSDELLLEATQLVIDNVTFSDAFTVALYHLDENELVNYDHETLDAVFQLFDER